MTMNEEQAITTCFSKECVYLVGSFKIMEEVAWTSTESPVGHERTEGTEGG